MVHDLVYEKVGETAGAQKTKAAYDMSKRMVYMLIGWQCLQWKKMNSFKWWWCFSYRQIDGLHKPERRWEYFVCVSAGVAAFTDEAKIQLWFQHLAWRLNVEFDGTSDEFPRGIPNCWPQYQCVRNHDPWSIS